MARRAKTNNPVIRAQGYYRPVDGDGIARELSDHEGEGEISLWADKTSAAQAGTGAWLPSAPPVALERVLTTDLAVRLAVFRQSLPEGKEAVLEAVTN